MRCPKPRCQGEVASGGGHQRHCRQVEHLKTTLCPSSSFIFSAPRPFRLADGPDLPSSNLRNKVCVLKGREVVCQARGTPPPEQMKPPCQQGLNPVNRCHPGHDSLLLSSSRHVARRKCPILANLPASDKFATRSSTSPIRRDPPAQRQRQGWCLHIHCPSRPPPSTARSWPN